MQMGQPGGQPDRGKLYSLGKCKFHGVPRNEKELSMINTSENKEETIKILRIGYVDAHKEEIADPNAGKRRNEELRKAKAEEFELIMGYKPHHFASIGTMEKKIKEAKNGQQEAEAEKPKKVKKE